MAKNKDNSEDNIFGSDELAAEPGVRSGYLCSPCEENSRYRKAIKYCQNCEEYFCSDCLQQHNQFRLMRNHVVTEAVGNGSETEPDLQTVNGDLPKCTIHISNFITKYCYQHKEVCCELCDAFKHRTCRDKTDINDAANNVKKSPEYKRQEECLASMASSLESLTSDIRRQLEQLDIGEEQSLRNVENYREELIATVVKQADESRIRIERFYSERKSRKQSDMTKLDLAVTSVNETLKELRSENNIRALLCLRSCACLLQEYKDFFEVTSSTEQRQPGFNIDMSLLKALSSHQCYYYEESLSTSATTSESSESPGTGFIFTTSATGSQSPATNTTATTTFSTGCVFGGTLNGASETASKFGGKHAVSSTVGEKTDGDKSASTGDSLFSWKPATSIFGASDMFKPKAGSWTCDSCYFRYEKRVLKCPYCETLKLGVKKEDIEDESASASTFTFSTSSGASSGFKFDTQLSYSSSAPTGTGFKLESSAAVSQAASGTGFKFGTGTEKSCDVTPSGAGFTFSTSATTSETLEPSRTGFIFTTSATGSQPPASTTAATTTSATGFVFGRALKGASESASTFGGKSAVNSTVEEKTDGGKHPSTGCGMFSWKPATVTFGATGVKPADSATPESAEAGKNVFLVTEEENSETTRVESKECGLNCDLAKMFNPKAGSWTCDGCYFWNEESVLKCPWCETLKPGVKKEDTKGSASGSTFTFSTSSGASSGFKFGIQPSYSSSAPTGTGFKLRTTAVVSQAASVTEFKFGTEKSHYVTPSGSGFKFSTSATTSGASRPSETGFIFTTSATGSQSPASTTAATTTSATGFVFGWALKRASETTSAFGGKSAVNSTVGEKTDDDKPASTGDSRFSWKPATFSFGGTGAKAVGSATPELAEAEKNAQSKSSEGESLLASLAAKHQDEGKVASSAAITPQKTVFQGFSLTSTPKVSQPKVEEEPKDIKPVVTTVAANTKPFSGFSLTPSKPAVSTPKVDTPVTQSTVGNQGSGPLFAFVQGSSPSFAGLAAEDQTTPAFQASGDGKGFFGIGTPVFAKTSRARRHYTSTGLDDHIEEYEPNVDFKPVVQLPYVLEDKSGEEEEEKISCEKAKLFRFDSEKTSGKRGVLETSKS